MKIKRYKKVHKYINFYVNNFKFRQPFQVLIDGTFCLTALKNKFNIQDQLPKYLQAELKLLTTQCVVLETEELGPKVFGAMKIVKLFSIHKCGHEKSRVSGSDCLKSMVKNSNKSRYIIATQDRELQKHLREIPGAPILYLHQVAPILEQPSEASSKLAEQSGSVRFSVSETQNTVLSKLKEKAGIEDADKPMRRKKKKKGPNPLSCLKKKNTVNKITKENNNNGKPQRKRVKIPKHIKEELLKTGK